ncbi:MAG: type II toxin-antitoxin system VapB family antitoxin [Syntrophobacteraceae bacterium]|jgi:hypothetical protein|nr:type II toxin-antitoxin system VapB family antitoxin [Syntrophobacteraceae bacterium]
MRTTVNIDDQTCQELMQLTSTTSSARAIRVALTEYIAWKRKKQLLDLRGKLDINDNWQELRSREMQEPAGE